MRTTIVDPTGCELARRRCCRRSSPSPLLRAACLLLLLSAPLHAQDGFTPIFNGKNLEGWKVMGVKTPDPDLWTVKDGILSAKPGTGWLSSTKMYGNFILRLEWRVPVDANSGVFIRVPDLKEKEQPWTAGMEIQILDDTGPLYKGKLKDYQYSGSIYSVVPPKKNVYKGAGQWNHFEITCKGDRIQVDFNGETIAVGDAGKPPLSERAKRGYVGLQNHGTAVDFRNIHIRTLED